MTFPPFSWYLTEGALVQQSDITIPTLLLSPSTPAPGLFYTVACLHFCTSHELFEHFENCSNVMVYFQAIWAVYSYFNHWFATCPQRELGAQLLTAVSFSHSLDFPACFPCFSTSSPPFYPPSFHQSHFKSINLHQLHCLNFSFYLPLPFQQLESTTQLSFFYISSFFTQLFLPWSPLWSLTSSVMGKLKFRCITLTLKKTDYGRC